MPCLRSQILESLQQCRRSCSICLCTDKGMCYGGRSSLSGKYTFWIVLARTVVCLLCCSQSRLTPWKPFRRRLGQALQSACLEFCLVLYSLANLLATSAGLVGLSRNQSQYSNPFSAMKRAHGLLVPPSALISAPGLTSETFYRSLCLHPVPVDVPVFCQIFDAMMAPFINGATNCMPARL